MNLAGLRARLEPNPCWPVAGRSNSVEQLPLRGAEEKPGRRQAKSRMEYQIQNTKKPRILCLHGFRTSGAILGKLMGKWPETVLGKLGLEFLNGPFPAQGKSDAEGFFDPPYYEWYQSSQDFKEYRNFEESMAYIEEYMFNHGPFDGLLGFSQGAMISAAVPGMQAQGMAFTRVPKVKFLILISGAKFGGYKLGQPKLAANAFSAPINCLSLHIIGEMDFLKAGSMDLVESFVDPFVIYHPRGHTVPRLNGKGLETALHFVQSIQKITHY